MSSHTIHQEKDNLISKLKREIDVNVFKCYQCGKCSAGCPLASDEMEYPPSVIMRLLQTEEPDNDDIIKKSFAIWVCLTCEMCFASCPMEIDIPKVMDYVRQVSVKEKKMNRKAKSIIASHEAFLNSIKRTGRLHELGFVMGYKFKTFELMKDAMLAPSMIIKGKLHIFAEKIKDKAHMDLIFKKTKNR
jgi:heterodisulfide reductase subunit C